MRPTFAFALLLMACTDERPRSVPATDMKLEDAAVDTRRATVKGDELAWGGVVVNSSDRFLRGADLEVRAYAEAGRLLGKGRGRVDLLPPGYGERLEINRVHLSEPRSVARVSVVLENVDLAPPGERPFAWKPATVTWKRPLPDGLSFAVEEDEKCAGVLGKKGAPATFRCVVGVRHTGTRAAKDLTLSFEPVRGGAPIAVRSSHPTDLPIEPGDALVFFVQATMATPSETILRGTAEARY